MTRLGLLVLAAALSGTGCAQPGYEATTEGAIGGTVLGGLIGGLAGGERGAAIGAGLGLALGGATGYALDQRKRQYASQEDFYDAQIRQTAQLNRQMATRNDTLSRSLAQDKREVKGLVSQYRAGRVNVAALRDEKADLDRKRKDNLALLSDLDKEMAVQRDVLAEARRTEGPASPHSRQLEQQVGELGQEVGELKSMVDDIGQQSATLGRYM